MRNRDQKNRGFNPRKRKMTNAGIFFLFFFPARKTRRDEPRAAGSSAAALAAHADRGGANGLGGLGRRYLKAAPGRCPARVRPEVVSFFLIILLGRKIKRNTKRTPKIPK